MDPLHGGNKTVVTRGQEPFISSTVVDRRELSLKKSGQSPCLCAKAPFSSHKFKSISQRSKINTEYPFINLTISTSFDFLTLTMASFFFSY